VNKVVKSDALSGLDAIDVHLLDLLQHDGRLSNKELAGNVGLSPSACLRRTQRLRSSGVVRGVHADVDPRALGVALQAMVSIRLRVHARDAFSAIRAHLRTLPEVVAIYSLGGADDLLLHVAVRDSGHLRDLTIDGLASRPEVGRMETALIFDHERSALPTLCAAPRLG
jgi:DNA-binding Lrp family transcriptional regulator